VWRTVLAFGGIPALATFYFRMKMPETARFTALVAKDARQAAEDMGQVGPSHLSAAATAAPRAVCDTTRDLTMCLLRRNTVAGIDALLLQGASCACLLCPLLLSAGPFFRVAAAPASRVQVLDTEFTEDDVELEMSADDYGLFSPEFNRKHGLHLIGCALCWFLLDARLLLPEPLPEGHLRGHRLDPHAPSVNALEEMWDGSRASVSLRMPPNQSGRKGTLLYGPAPSRTQSCSRWHLALCFCTCHHQVLRKDGPALG